MRPATSSERKGFDSHPLNRANSKPGRQPLCGRRHRPGGSRKDKRGAKGYQRGGKRLIILRGSELEETIALDSTKDLDIDMFDPRDSVEWDWLDTP